MSSKPPSPAWLAWLPVITTALMIAGLLLTTGKTLSKVDDHDRRIGVLEAYRDTISDKLDKINERTARIEAKVEVLQPVRDTEGKGK